MIVNRDVLIPRPETEELVGLILSQYDAVALCCGAKKARTLKVKGEDSYGVFFAVDFLKSVTKCVIATQKALSQIDMQPTNGQIAQMLLDRYGIAVEGKNVVIVGGGDTGNDCCGSAIRLTPEKAHCLAFFRRGRYNLSHQKKTTPEESE